MQRLYWTTRENNKTADTHLVATIFSKAHRLTHWLFVQSSQIIISLLCLCLMFETLGLWWVAADWNIRGDLPHLASRCFEEDKWKHEFDKCVEISQTGQTVSSWFKGAYPEDPFREVCFPEHRLHCPVFIFSLLSAIDWSKHIRIALVKCN